MDCSSDAASGTSPIARAATTRSAGSLDSTNCRRTTRASITTVVSVASSIPRP
ncbi:MULTISPECIES: hypothetical protein [unclassified Allobranchiibius]|uniref:hypothetical protein n=1 Tax=unclassified Allobranchiibius TaxID=2649857 RepID=UPI001AA0E0A9|nr:MULTISPECIES: hypothetical protein [unclassified Allobranchiibius]MBO1767179.1 hypothetical protein [Allobranchiibius sp. GilTou38]UIJ35816.1 hypothetical protein LVQ62_05390 [Allobranchiibius sp. GilTou73]